MKEVDYIVVGLGIAGVSFCERLMQSKKEFVVFDVPDTSATRVAGGIVNPLVLKRVTQAWNAVEFLSEAVPFYEQLNKRLKSDICVHTKVSRIFNNVQEQNDWLVASDTSKLSAFLLPEITSNAHNGLIAPLGLGIMNKALQIDTKAFLEMYRAFMEAHGKLVSKSFQYNTLKIEDENVHYGDIKSKYIVFSEGAAIIKNPYFQNTAIIPKKGEYITIKSVDLQLDQVVKGPFFIIPLGGHLYKIGATFAYGDDTYAITEKGREQLISAVKKMISCPFEVVNQEAGMRPTVKDRRPIIGNISHKRIQFFNGLGTRGLLMAPLLSKMLFEYVENGIPLLSEIDIKRFSPYQT